MKLLILFIAMGVIGVIGTVEYSHAQTPLTITPTNIPDAIQGTTGLHSTGITNTWINLYNRTIFNLVTPHHGTMHVQSDTLIESNAIFENITSEITCHMDLRKISEVLREQTLKTNTHANSKIDNIGIPDNITPQDSITAIGIDFRTPETRNSTCTPDPEANTSNPLITKKELRYTLLNQSDKKAYYFTPTKNIIQAQPIPLCSNENFNTNNQTLKGDTKMCYGKHESNMVIITKKLTGFYGAAETITTPAKPIALDSDVIETVETVKERERLKALKEKQEKEYLALLKKLYLPAV